MKFDVEQKDKAVVIRTKVDKLDTLNAPELKTELVYQNKQDQKNIILDMSETRYCDSSGLSAVLVANRLCREAEGTFVLCGLQSSVSKLITISQLDSVLKIANDVDDAVALVQQ